MFATIQTTVLPEFAVEVYPTAEADTARQRYVLVVRDGTVGKLERVFPSAQDLRAFLADARMAFAAARYGAKVRRDRLRPSRKPTEADGSVLVQRTSGALGRRAHPLLRRRPTTAGYAPNSGPRNLRALQLAVLHLAAQLQAGLGSFGAQQQRDELIVNPRWPALETRWASLTRSGRLEPVHCQ